MTEPLEPVATTSSSLTPLYGGGIVQQSHSAAANRTDVAASTTRAISVPGGTGTKSSAAAASGGNVAAIQTTITEQVTSSEYTQIEEDPRAQLAYYLKCINAVFRGFYGVCNEVVKDLSFSEFERLLDYENARQLTAKQCDKLLLLADTLPPTLFINKVFFENAEKCRGCKNEFYKIEEVEKSLAVRNDVMFRGENRHITKIMYYTPKFLKDRYYDPMGRLEHRLQAIRKGQHLETFSENYKVHIFLSLLFPFWIIVWTALCIQESKPSDPTSEEAVP